MPTVFLPRLRLLALAAAGCLALAQVAVADTTWPSFQNGGSVSFPQAASTFSGTLADGILWKATPPGYGQSSPVVWNDRVYVTSVVGKDKNTYYVTAFRLADGSQLWQKELNNATPQESSNYISRAAPTPAADADGVICFFEGGNLAAFTHDGDLRWERNLAGEYGPIAARHGLGSSVEQDDTAAFIWVERSEAPYILSVDKQTGKNNWKVDGVGATSWSTPRLVPVEDGKHLVLSASGSLTGIDPQTGERLWTLDGISGNSTPTPVPVANGRFLIGATTGRGHSDAGRAAASNGLVQISKNDEGTWQAKFLWRAKRATCSFCSPIAHEGRAYFVNRAGVLYGLDLQSGEELFNKRLGGGVWATPIGIGDRVLFFGKIGVVNILSDTEESPELTTWESLPEAVSAPTENDKPESGEKTAEGSAPVLYGASWCGDVVLLRRGDGLFAVKTPKE